MIESKEQVIRHYQGTIEKALGWRLLTNKVWRTPIVEGKWTIAEVVGHFAPWDEFVRLKRIPHFLSGGPLPKSLDVEQTNRERALTSQSCSQEDIIAEFIHNRKRLITAIEQIENERWEREYMFNQTPLTLSAYFQGLLEHDVYHFRQIASVWNKEG